jgi:hypothetical protein
MNKKCKPFNVSWSLNGSNYEAQAPNQVVKLWICECNKTTNL